MRRKWKKMCVLLAVAVVAVCAIRRAVTVENADASPAVRSEELPDVELPIMTTGMVYLNYQIFFFDNDGNKALFRGNDTEFDLNFGSSFQHHFDAKEIADYLEEVHGCLKDSILLLTSDDGIFRSGGSGADFEEDFFCGHGIYEGDGTVLEKLKAYEAAALQAQADLA